VDSLAKNRLRNPGLNQSQLVAKLSAVLRDQLLRDVGNLNSAEGAAVWARRTLPAKNTLHEADAREVEEAFAAKLPVINGPSNDASGSDRHDEPQAQPTNANVAPATSAPADPHHLRFAQSRALGRKVSDEWVVALCRGHHREVHRHGDERGWWEKSGIDPNGAARSLWLQSHPTRSLN
jgi:hypothetical protein